jgi:hypothetical protein
LKDPYVNGKIILKWILETGMGAWTGTMWLRIRAGDGLL